MRVLIDGRRFSVILYISLKWKILFPIFFKKQTLFVQLKISSNIFWFKKELYLEMFNQSPPWWSNHVSKMEQKFSMDYFWRNFANHNLGYSQRKSTTVRPIDCAKFIWASLRFGLEK